MTRPYCTHPYFYCNEQPTCDGCRLEAACNAMAIGLCIAGLAAMLVETWRGVAVSERYACGVLATRAGIAPADGGLTIAAHDFGHTEDK